MKSAFIFSAAAICAFVIESSGQAPANWVVRNPSPDAGALGVVTFNDGRFVLADTTGGMLTSLDGRHWTRTAVPYSPVKIVYAQGKYVAAIVSNQSGFGEVYTSTDGETWTPRSSTFSVVDLAYLNALFIAIGRDSIMISPDGESWIPDLSEFNWRLQNVAYGNGTYVVVGAYFTPLGNVPLVLTSTNGVDWTRHTPPGGHSVLYAVTFGNGIFVANGDSGNFLTSSDGIDWTVHGGIHERVQEPAIAILELAFGNGYFLASSVNHSSADYVYYSTNGIDWAAGCLRCVGPSSAPFHADSFAIGNGQFITANTEGEMFIATDPRQWSVLRVAEDLNGIAYGAGRFVAVGNRSTVLSSSDGRDWTYAFGGRKNSNLPDLFGVAFGNNIFVAVGGSGPYMATSRDGSEWVEQNALALGTSEWLRGVVFGNGLFVAAGERIEGTATHVPKIVISRDGTNWTYPAFTATTTGFNGVGYGNGVYVVVGDQGAIVSSPDGTTWTVRASGTSQTLRAVTFHNGRFLAGGEAGTIVTSTDGANWSVSSPTSFASRGLGSGNGVIAVGNFQNDGRLHYSSDGLGWPGNSMAFSHVLNAVAYGNGSWMAVGNDGFIIQGISQEIRLSQPRKTGSGFEMLIETQGQVSSYQIQGSTNLTDWTTLLTLIGPPQSYVYRDETANANLMRFYRVVSP